MVPWRIAWRSKRAALRAAIVPFCLIFILVVTGERLIEEVVLRLVGGMNAPLAAQASRTIIDALYMAIDGVLIAALLETLLSGHKLADSLPPLLPTQRVLQFALALIPIGLATGLLHLGLRYGERVALVWLADDLGDNPEGHSRLAAVWSPVSLFLNTPKIQWVLAGLAVPWLALRLLSLPALIGNGRTTRSTKPTLGLAGALLVAVVVGTVLDVALRAVLDRGLGQGLDAVPGAETTAVPLVVGEYVIVLVGACVLTFITALLIAASVAMLLWRRRSSSDAPADQLT